MYKVYPFFIEGNDGLSTYINSLIYEFEGRIHGLNDTQASMMQTIIDIYEHFYDDSLTPEPNLEVIRREWLNCMNLMNKIANHGDNNEHL